MAESGSAVASLAAVQAATETSSYRVKLAREEFIRLVRFARPRVIFHRRKNLFFAYGGFVVYSQECIPQDFPGQNVIEAKELSNYAWAV